MVIAIQWSYGKDTVAFCVSAWPASPFSTDNGCPWKYGNGKPREEQRQASPRIPAPTRHDETPGAANGSGGLGETRQCREGLSPLVHGSRP